MHNAKAGSITDAGKNRWILYIKKTAEIFSAVSLLIQVLFLLNLEPHEAVREMILCILFSSLESGTGKNCSGTEHEHEPWHCMVAVSCIRKYGMAVGYYEARFGITCNHGFVSVYRNFLDGVLNELPLVIFSQTRETTCPVGVLVENKSLSCVCSVGQKFYGDFVRTDSVSIIAVSPGLGNRNAGFFRGVAVGDVEFIISCRITVNRGFCYCVKNFLTAVFVFVKVCKSI